MRRVWIEITKRPQAVEMRRCHPPCGGCGLKYDEKDVLKVVNSHPPCGGCGLKF